MRWATRLASSLQPAVPEPFDPQRIISVLGRHQVRYVLIGALAARLQGFPRLTAGADITPARDAANLENLAAALRELEARVYPRRDERLRRHQGFGAALRDIVRSKKAAGRPQDRQDVAVMVAMLRKRPAPKGGKT